MKAFNLAKDKSKSKSKYGDEFIEQHEYRWLLKYLAQYYEYWQLFD